MLVKPETKEDEGRKTATHTFLDIVGDAPKAWRAEPVGEKDRNNKATRLLGERWSDQGRTVCNRVSVCERGMGVQEQCGRRKREGCKQM